MPSTPDTISRAGWTPEPGMVLPDEESAVEAQLVRVRQEKKLALEEPGLSWSEWFYFREARWLVGVGILIVFIWEILYLLPPANAPAYEVGPVMAATVYAGFLLWQFLWFRPMGHSPSRSTRDGRFRPSWTRPVPYGRWTPEAEDHRAGRTVPTPQQGPDLREFL